MPDTSQPAHREDSFAGVLEFLFAEFEREHSLTTIHDVAVESRAHLAEHARDEAFPELLHRLARARLVAMSPTAHHDR
jgi:hypothetical protein